MKSAVFAYWQLWQQHFQMLFTTFFHNFVALSLTLIKTIMKKLFYLFLLSIGSTSAFSQQPVVGTQIDWTLQWGKPIVSPIVPKKPIESPTVSINGHTLYFNNIGYNFIIALRDENGDIAYFTNVLTGTTTLVLPSYLAGDYTIELYPGGNYYYEGVIEL